MYTVLNFYVDSVLPELDHLPKNRRVPLQHLASYVVTQLGDNRVANLTFICTHNSRRSILAQVWAEVAAKNFLVSDQLQSYSGGTEVTAFHVNAIASLRRCGFEIDVPSGGNPTCSIKYGSTEPEIQVFSKLYNDRTNPQQFAAIMTCKDANENCPFIPGADLRISLPYNDPKASDGTPEESSVYDQRSREIAIEMFYLMREVKRIKAAL